MFLNQLKNPSYLASLLAIQRIKKRPDRTVPGTCVVELDGSHPHQVSIYANSVKAIPKV